MKRKTRDFFMYLQDIVESADRIEEYIKNTTEKEFSYHQETKDAVVMRIGVIGEAVKNLPPTIKKHYQEVDWKKTVKMRNIFTHEYFGINYHRLWKTAKHDIPLLKERILEILGDLKIRKLI